MAGGLPHHVEPAVLVEEEVLKDHGPHGDLEPPLSSEGVDLGVHEGELLASVLVTVLENNVQTNISTELIARLHDQDDVTPGPEDAEELGQGGGVDLAGGQPVGGHDDVIRLVVDGNGA